MDFRLCAIVLLSAVSLYAVPPSVKALSFPAEKPPAKAQATSNGLPNTSARFHPNSRDWTVFADLLVWTAKEVGADCWAEVIHSDSSNRSNDIHAVDFGWDPGFRVGVGYGMKHDQWDTQIYYTWFQTRGKDAISSDPGTVHSAFLGNFYVDNALGLGLSGPAYQRAHIDWTIHFNMFDWELGRNFWVSKSLALRPFLGVKGGWIDQRIHSKWENPDLPSFLLFDKGTENLKNDFWGIGPAVGLSTMWNLLTGQNQLYLFGDFSGAIMWGHWSFDDRFKNDFSQSAIVGFPQRVTIDLQHINGGASMLRTVMGLGWNVSFSQNQYRLSTKLGYELQFWLDQLQFYSFTGGRLVNQLTLQGGTFEFCFDF